MMWDEEDQRIFDECQNELQEEDSHESPADILYYDIAKCTTDDDREILMYVSHYVVSYAKKSLAIYNRRSFNHYGIPPTFSLNIENFPFPKNITAKRFENWLEVVLPLM